MTIYGPPVSPTDQRVRRQSHMVIYPDQTHYLYSYPDTSIHSPAEASPSSSRTTKRRAVSLDFHITSPTGSRYSDSIASLKSPASSHFIPLSPLRSAHLQENGYPKACARIPQITYSEPSSSSFQTKAYATFRHPCITFQQQGKSGLGVRVGDILDARKNIRKLKLLGCDDQELRRRGGDGQIKVRISWPGYRLDPFQQRMDTRESLISRGDLLVAIAECVHRFTEEICTQNIPVERGYELWGIGIHPSGKPGMKGTDVVITALHHCGGYNWQPELWIPDEKIKTKK